MKFAAVIFDLDGTIINSNKEWVNAFNAVLLKLDAKFDPNETLVLGLSTKANWEILLAKYKIKTDKTLEELETLTNQEYLKLLSQVTLNDGVQDFMESLQENGTPLALATSTDWEVTSKVLEYFGLTEYFETITTGEEVGNPKPAPDIYILASEKLGVDPNDCLVLEDSPPGVTSAKEAGMHVIAVNDDEDMRDKLEDADLIVESFSEISLKAVDAIAQG